MSQAITATKDHNNPNIIALPGPGVPLKFTLDFKLGLFYITYLVLPQKFKLLSDRATLQMKISFSSGISQNP